MSAPARTVRSICASISLKMSWQRRSRPSLSSGPQARIGTIATPVREGDMLFGDSVLQFDDVHCASVGVAESREPQDRRDVRLILAAYVAHFGAIGKVVFAVRHFEAALQQIRYVTLWVVEAGSYPQPEEVGCMKVGFVQGVDIRPEGFTQSSCKVVFVADGGNCVEVRAQRSDAFGFDGVLVHEGVVEVGNFA